MMQVAPEASDLESYFCSHLRLMPLGTIDPSLAIGFYCGSAGATLWRGDSSCLLSQLLLHVLLSGQTQLQALVKCLLPKAERGHSQTRTW